MTETTGVLLPPMPLAKPNGFTWCGVNALYAPAPLNTAECNCTVGVVDETERLAAALAVGFTDAVSFEWQGAGQLLPEDLAVCFTRVARDAESLRDDLSPRKDGAWAPGELETRMDEFRRAAVARCGRCTPDDLGSSLDEPTLESAHVPDAVAAAETLAGMRAAHKEIGGTFPWRAVAPVPPTLRRLLDMYAAHRQAAVELACTCADDGNATVFAAACCRAAHAQDSIAARAQYIAAVIRKTNHDHSPRRAAASPSPADD